MSAQATGWVWEHKPFTGERLIVLLAIADVVNDVHDNEFWMTTGTLAEKASVDRRTVSRTLSELVERGLLAVVERGVGRGNATRFRFTFGDGVLSTSGAPSPTFSPQQVGHPCAESGAAGPHIRNNPKEPNGADPVDNQRTPEWRAQGRTQARSARDHLRRPVAEGETA